MDINSHQLGFTLTVEDLGVWMSALRLAARDAVPVVPWDSCPFVKQHKELVRLSGFGTNDHARLLEDLKMKYEERHEANLKTKYEI